MTAQLMSAGDDEAGGCGNPVCVSALLAHLLFLRANGNLAAATALADTFGTVAFVEVCASVICASVNGLVEYFMLKAV